ncbi:MAG: DUF2786 domain-containing protein [Fusobacteriaceae bacterium]
MDKNIQDKIDKLKRLAEDMSTTRHERDNAKEKMKNLINKHKLDAPKNDNVLTKIKHIKIMPLCEVREYIERIIWSSPNKIPCSTYGLNHIISTLRHEYNVPDYIIIEMPDEPGERAMRRVKVRYKDDIKYPKDIIILNLSIC